MNYLNKEPRESRPRVAFEGPEPPPVAERPECPGCGVRLVPQIWGGYAGTLRRWAGYKGYGAFCTLTCAAQYANTVYKRTGFRYTKVKNAKDN